MTSTYWLIGQHIVEFEQSGEERAKYGKELLKKLSEDLNAKYGRGFGQRNIYQMRLFFLTYQNILQDFNAENKLNKPS